MAIELLLNKESAHLPWGATLAVITAVVSEELLAVVARLKASGRRLVLICLTDDPLPVPMPGILMERVQELDDCFSFRVETQA
jgi:uncharacterized membrane protein